MTENDISFIIIGFIFHVYNNLDPGLLESVYKAALMYELKNNNFNAKSQVTLPVHYKEIKLEVKFWLDLLVEDLVIIVIKSIEELKKVLYKQLMTYLKLSTIKLGILVNFNTDDIRENIKRVANNL